MPIDLRLKTLLEAALSPKTIYRTLSQYQADTYGDCPYVARNTGASISWFRLTYGSLCKFPPTWEQYFRPSFTEVLQNIVVSKVLTKSSQKDPTTIGYP